MLLCGLISYYRSFIGGLISQMVSRYFKLLLKLVIRLGRGGPKLPRFFTIVGVSASTTYIYRL